MVLAGDSGGERPLIPVQPESCRGCLHFNGAAAALEAALPGLTSLGSAHADVRSDDGLCALHARYVTASSICSAAALKPWPPRSDPGRRVSGF